MNDKPTIKVGDEYSVWWDTGRKTADGQNMAEVLAILPYTGRYPQWFCAVLRLRAPNTKRGWMEMAVGGGR